MTASYSPRRARKRAWVSQGIASSQSLVSVNLSARELAHSSIRDSVSLSLLETGFDPANLIIEITESALMRDLDSTVRNFKSLKSLGLRIAATWPWDITLVCPSVPPRPKSCCVLSSPRGSTCEINL